MSKLSADIVLNAKKLKCPLPLLKTKMALKNMDVNQILLVQATDAGSKRDIPKYIELSQHTLLSSQLAKSVIEIYIKVGLEK